MHLAEQRDPSDDPAGWLVDVLGRYFPPGWVESVIRTWVPIAIGAVLAWVNAHWEIVLAGDASTTAIIIATAAVTAGYYALARLVERRWPSLGRWLVALNLVKARPTYRR